MIWNTITCIYEDANMNEIEHAMEFLTSITIENDLKKCQQLFVLSQAMDLNTLVWFLGVCLIV